MDPAGSGNPPRRLNSLDCRLPFVDRRGQDHGYLGDGIAEEVLNRLAQSKDLRVISRTSSFSFRGKPLDVREIASKLDVDHVLEGSVRRSGDSIRITAQLIAASDNSHVWSGTFDREFGDTFRVQDEIAGSVATALQVTLDGSGLGINSPIEPEAHERFLQGQFFYLRRSPGDIDRAVDYFEQAVRRSSISRPGPPSPVRTACLFMTTPARWRNCGRCSAMRRLGRSSWRPGSLLRRHASASTTSTSGIE
jgi:TolB-like protein